LAGQTPPERIAASTIYGAAQRMKRANASKTKGRQPSQCRCGCPTTGAHAQLMVAAAGVLETVSQQLAAGGAEPF